jgi:hypothetical protein
VTQPIDPPKPVEVVPISVERAIALTRWWLRLGAAFNGLMVVAFALAMVFGFQRNLGSTPLLLAIAIWVVVAMFSVRARRLAIDAVPLIAAGEFGLAEDRISQSLKSFSVIRSSKLLGLQQLALLRHAQRRWDESALLARELLLRRGRRDGDIELPTRLMLAEALLEAGDVRGASEEVAFLYRARLNLRDTLMLTHLNAEVQLRLGRFRELSEQIPHIVSLAELMPPALAARTHAALAVAARQTNRQDWFDFLSRRARLLGDAEAIRSARPFLREAFDAVDSGPSPADSSPQVR